MDPIVQEVRSIEVLVLVRKALRQLHRLERLLNAAAKDLEDLTPPHLRSRVALSASVPRQAETPLRALKKRLAIGEHPPTPFQELLWPEDSGEGSGVRCGD